MKVRSKRIYLNQDKSKYCITKVFDCKESLNDYYQKHGNPEHKDSTVLKPNHIIAGASLHYSKWNPSTKVLSKETGQVILCRERLEPAIVAHEFMHAVLWARKHTKYKKQYPIKIKSIHDEEKMLYNLSYALEQFYKWYK